MLLITSLPHGVLLIDLLFPLIRFGRGACSKEEEREEESETSPYRGIRYELIFKYGKLCRVRLPK